MAKIVILGASGFIGNYLYNYLSNKIDFDIITAGRSNSDVYVDFTNDCSSLIHRVVPGDFVVFLSSISSPAICEENSAMAHNVNVARTCCLIEKLTGKGVKVIFSSSDTVFGGKKSVAMDESQLMPFGIYAEMKAEVEKLFFDNELVKNVRFSYVLGPGDKYTSMLDAVAEDGKILDVFSGFERNIISLHDVVEGLFSLIKKWDEILSHNINFGGPELVSRWELTQQYTELIRPNLKSVLVHAPSNFWKSRPKTIEMNSDFLDTILNRPRLSISEYLKKWESIWENPF